MAQVATATTPQPARSPGRSGANARSRRRLDVFRIGVFIAAALFFLVPIAAMFEFSTRGTGIGAPRTLSYWRAIPSDPDLTAAIVVSLELAVITSIGALVLLVPTMVWVKLRVPRLNPVIEFLCLLPLTIPAIVLVVGLAPVYAWVTYFFGDSTLNLWWAYVILVLPYVYRTLDVGIGALDLRTLSEAARSLGAGWFTVIFRVITPNLSSALINSAVLSVSLVLGEFTVASLLNYQNLQVEINNIGQANAGVSIAVAVALLIFVFVLLIGLSFLERRRRGQRAVEEA
jgi:putative spermidine/putrescine transport system permease protein